MKRVSLFLMTAGRQFLCVVFPTTSCLGGSCPAFRSLPLATVASAGAQDRCCTSRARFGRSACRNCKRM